MGLDIFRKVRYKLYFFIMKIKYRRVNFYIDDKVIINNYTKCEGFSKINSRTNISNTYIGRGTYISNDCKLQDCIIGRFTSIGSNVEIIAGQHPTEKFASTHPAFYSINKQSGFTFVENTIYEETKCVNKDKHYLISIGNDVWIGNNVKILNGVRIGDGSVIGANSLVTKDVEPYSINVGLPCKKIKYRFDKDQREFLQKFKWWDKDFEWLKNNCDLMQDIEKLYAKYNDKEC